MTLRTLSQAVFLGAALLATPALADIPVPSDRTALMPSQPMPAPPFPALDAMGAQQNLQQLGKVAVITVWQEHCPGCRVELPKLSALKESMGDSIEVIALSVDRDFSTSERELARRGLTNLTSFHDPERANAAYFARHIGLPGLATPISFVIGKDGMIKASVLGFQDWSKPVVQEYLAALTQQ